MYTIEIVIKIRRVIKYRIKMIDAYKNFENREFCRDETRIRRAIQIK